MNSDFGCKNWQDFIPIPVCEDYPEFLDFYKKAWEIAYSHIKSVDGMPQNPYMDEAFCESQVWIWDSCFMALFCKFAREVFPGVETLKNFYSVLYEKKQLPKIIPPENEPEWTGAKSGVPYNIDVHIADNPPLFAWAEYENALMSGDKEYLKELLNEHKFLQKHYEWIEGLSESQNLKGVNVKTNLISEKYGYKWEGGSSGMDNTPRGRTTEHAEMQRPNNPNMLWIDAICQQALSANMISKLYTLIEDKASAKKWEEKYLEKKKIINSMYWDNETNFYYDIDYITNDFYKVMTIASFWAMTANVATKEEAEILVKHLSNPETFGGFVPFVSLSRDDADYNSKGGYWRGSVWLPTAYAALKGLSYYGYFKEAHETGLKLFKHMQRTYNDFSPHTIWEAYSPEEFKPATTEFNTESYVRPDFCGWSALGPISVYIECVLGFYSINAFEKKVKWAKPDSFSKKTGIKNLRFGNIITDIEAFDKKCCVKSNEEYILEINGKEYFVSKGINEFIL